MSLQKRTTDLIERLRKTEVELTELKGALKNQLAQAEKTFGTGDLNQLGQLLQKAKKDSEKASRNLEIALEAYNAQFPKTV